MPTFGWELPQDSRQTPDVRQEVCEGQRRWCGPEGAIVLNPTRQKYHAQGAGCNNSLIEWLYAE